MSTAITILTGEKPNESNGKKFNLVKKQLLFKLF